MISVIDGELYQWDTGRQVKVTSKKNYTIEEVHFCNEDSESALVCEATVEGSVATAFIPNILLQSDKELIVYAVVTTDDDRRTVERNTFRVFERKRPDDYVYTETEVFSYKALEDRVKKLEESPIDSEAIATAVSEYMKENPISIPDEYVTDEELEKKGSALKSELPNVPVQSVNGKTGDVQLGAEDVGARPNTWTPTANDVGADSAGTAQTKVDEHNVNTESHNDIRLLIEGLTSRLNALADSDDTTLDQLSEVVAYIKSNKSLIDAITTNKISYSDIVDNLTTNVSDKPLSAAQGVVLKALFDSIPAWAKAETKPSYTADEVGAATPEYVDNAVKDAVKRTGDTMTGILVADSTSNAMARQVRNIWLANTVPSNDDGANGDIWLVYK